MVLSLLSRRIDYVHENVKATEKRLQKAEEHLEAADVVGVRNESGIPLTEISEELDEEGNVISSSVSKPGDAVPSIIEALRKNGVLDQTGAGIRDKPDSSRSQVPIEQAKVNCYEPANLVSQHASKTISSDMVQATPKSTPVEPHQPTVNRDQEIERHSSNSSGGSGSEGRDDTSPNFRDRPVIPTDESPEDLKLRQEIMQYVLSDQQPVVAEMNLSKGYEDEGSDIVDDEEDASDSENYNTDEEDEEEDDYGRTTKRVVDDDYRARMLEIERRLNVQRPERMNRMSKPEHSEQPDIRDSSSMPPESVNIGDEGAPPETKKAKKKGVRFAESLDIQEVPPSSFTAAQSDPTRPETFEDPVAESVVERVQHTSDTKEVSEPVVRQSRFKAAKTKERSGAEPKSPPMVFGPKGNIANGPLGSSTASLVPAVQTAPNSYSGRILAANQEPQPTPPTGPKGKTHADVLVERPTTENNSNVSAPDELDSALLQQQVTVEYHRMRNRMIHRNGGFKASDDEQFEGPLVDENGRKISRFKAAKLSKLEQ